jgi:uncharacterized membrane protein YhaH (DUF805 family)
MFLEAIRRSFLYNTANRRISRGQYIISVCLLVAICFAIATLLDIYWLQNLTFIPFAISISAAIFLGIKRLNDLDEPRRQILFLAIPILNLYIQYVFWFKKWTVGDNKFGKDPLEYQPKNNSLYRLIGILLTAVYIYLSKLLPQ